MPRSKRHWFQTHIILRATLTAALASAIPIASADDESILIDLDAATRMCLTFEYNHHLDICAVVAPALYEDVRRAHDMFRARNVDQFAELAGACERRLFAVYGGDEHRILEAKNAAVHRRKAFVADFVSTPENFNQVNCEAYARDYANPPSENFDDLSELIKLARSPLPQRAGE